MFSLVFLRSIKELPKRDYWFIDKVCETTESFKTIQLFLWYCTGFVHAIFLPQVFLRVLPWDNGSNQCKAKQQHADLHQCADPAGPTGPQWQPVVLSIIFWIEQMHRKDPNKIYWSGFWWILLQFKWLDFKRNHVNQFSHQRVHYDDYRPGTISPRSFARSRSLKSNLQAQLIIQKTMTCSAT